MARGIIAVAGSLALIAGCQLGASNVETQGLLLTPDGSGGAATDGEESVVRADAGREEGGFFVDAAIPIDGALPVDGGGQGNLGDSGWQLDAGLDADAGPDAVDDAGGNGSSPDAGDDPKPPVPATISSLSKVAEDLLLQSTAVGRRSLDGETPTISLERSGYTHPSVIYVPEGWNGYSYWMAVSPYFGPIGHDDQYENPHIFRSVDGLHWEEPFGLANPIDRPPDAPSQTYWSDPHLVLTPAGVLYCFYRGAGPEYGGRSLTYRMSWDGVHWSLRHFAYSTASLASVDYTNKLLSPVVIENGEGWDVFDAIRSSPTALWIAEQKNQTSTFVVRRSSPAIGGGYGEYAEQQVVSFLNRPWGPQQDPWHLDVRLFQGRWFMLLNTGSMEQSSGDALWLAVSEDGSSYSVVETPVFASGTYRSALVPMDGDENGVRFLVYRSQISDGTIDLYELRIRF